MDVCNLLIIDDDPNIRSLLNELLAGRQDLLLFTAGSGQEAVKHFAANRVDVVLTDIHMPGFTGLELMADMKKINFKPEILVMTANATPESVETSRRIGARSVILKPFDDLEVVEAEINKAVAAARAARGRAGGHVAAHPSTAPAPAAPPPAVRSVPVSQGLPDFDAWNGGLTGNETPPPPPVAAHPAPSPIAAAPAPAASPRVTPRPAPVAPVAPAPPRHRGDCAPCNRRPLRPPPSRRCSPRRRRAPPRSHTTPRRHLRPRRRRLLQTQRPRPRRPAIPKRPWRPRASRPPKRRSRRSRPTWRTSSARRPASTRAGCACRRLSCACRPGRKRGQSPLCAGWPRRCSGSSTSGRRARAWSRRTAS
ncbi:MAG: response regulator [Acidobacteria bacterium]|nr:response regulator [Acidobacteriota bacterium]